jgi:hypothetical protein
MTSPDFTERDRRLLDLIVDSLPKGVPPEQHREGIASILEFFEHLHGELGAVVPGWLLLGRQLYLTHPEPNEERT